MKKQEFINAGFTVVDSEASENKLLRFLKENYPSIIKDNEINVQELKAIAGLPVDEKVNGYGLNFVGRNFARAKYAQKTDKELRLNKSLSKDIDTTRNLVLKGDNLDCLKILKNHYSGKIKCIYIDPPYNTNSDEFVYPDRFDREELEVLGFQNLSEEDFARMDFSFKTKKSHNGWLSFMYPRLLLARDLLSNDGVIFISIDDNEQANLKLLCDDVFGEENFIGGITWLKKRKGSFLSKQLVSMTEYILVYSKDKSNDNTYLFGGVADETESQPIIKRTNQVSVLKIKPNVIKTKLEDGTYKKGVYGDNVNPVELLNDVVFENGYNLNEFEVKAPFTWTQDFFDEELKKGSKPIINTLNFQIRVFRVNSEDSFKGFGSLIDGVKIKGTNEDAYEELESLLGLKKIFDYSKPKNLIKELIAASTKFNENSIILDFFAGSGTTGHAVMQLNAEDGGKRKFILCQIDEPIKEDKPAYKFCIDNNLPPVISSITIERLKRAGEKIKKEIEAENSKIGMFDEDKKQVPDIGFKVFDTVEAPELKADDKGQISIHFNDCDAISRIYNMIFTVGLDEPTQVPEEVVKDCIYRIGSNYYITNSDRLSRDDLAEAMKNGRVFIDGWTASLNVTLVSFKEDVKIVF
jgi:adenine-specific DNA-methyltransferase